MKILITGSHGQLGTELLRQLKEGRSEIGPIPEKLCTAKVIPTDADELDITETRLWPLCAGWSRM